jgi:hypothetical protein
MTQHGKPGAGGSAPSSQSSDGSAPPEKKPRRTPAPRIPAGMQQIKFLLPQSEYDTLTKIGDLDDRKPDDLARVLTRKHIRSHKEEAG